MSDIHCWQRRPGPVWRAGWKVALALVCMAGGGASAQTIDATVAQAGGDSGIRSRSYGTWLPAGRGFAGVSGRVTLAGNAAGFDEALVALGASADDRAGCRRYDGQTSDVVPDVTRLWAGILKSNDAAAVGIPVAVALPHAVAPASAVGTCLLTTVSAGYAFLRRDAALYATTTVRLRVATGRAEGAAVQTFGIGGEFRFAQGAPGGRANYVGIRANRAMALDAVAVSLSAAPVAGAPAGSGWGEMLRGAWRVSTRFLYLPASACRAAALTGRQPGVEYDVLRLGTPAAMAEPVGGTALFDATLEAVGRAAAQRAGFVALARPRMLAPGDCVIAFAAVPPGGKPGEIDVENQSTLYLRPLKGGPR